MTLWRLEWLRIVRTKRWLALVGVYLFFGFLGPLTARFLAEIVSFAGGELEGATIQFPPPVPADGMAQYVSNAMQIGTLVTVVVAAGAVAIDTLPEMGVFLRTRIPEVARILTPRVVVTSAAVIASFTLGALGAWYETWVLLGAPDAGAVLAGIGFGALFLVFVVALVAAVAGRATSALGTVMASVVILLLMPVIGIADAVGRWLPTYLSGALGALPAGRAEVSGYIGAAGVTIASIIGLLWLAGLLNRRREL